MSPELARVPRDLFRVRVVGIHGEVLTIGDAEHEFAMMSVSTPFVFALVREAIGVEDVRRRIGSSAGVQLADGHRAESGRPDQPVVNSGAIGTTSLFPGRTFESKWRWVQERERGERTGCPISPRAPR